MWGKCELEEMCVEPCTVSGGRTYGTQLEVHLYRCSRCEGLCRSVNLRYDPRQAYNYCPRCGRKVVRICMSSS